MAFFLAAPSIFTVLPREDAGKVVSDIFPKYYWQGIICGAIALVTSVVLGMRERWNILLIVRTIMIGVMVVGVLYSVVILQPKIHTVRAQITAFEALSPTDPLRIEVWSAARSLIQRERRRAALRGHCGVHHGLHHEGVGP
jgi:hypothetical protein